MNIGEHWCYAGINFSRISMRMTGMLKSGDQGIGTTAMTTLTTIFAPMLSDKRRISCRG